MKRLSQFSRPVRAALAAVAILTVSSCDIGPIGPIDLASFPPIELPPIPAPAPPPAPAPAPAPAPQVFQNAVVFEASRPVTSGGQNGANRCTGQQANCGNQNAAAAAPAKQQAAVNSILANSNTGAAVAVTVTGNTDLRCGANSAGGNISCGPGLANQRANAAANDLASQLAA